MINKISVIVPVYNLEKELARCVASIQAQTYTNLEIILIDDGSKDNSRAVIERLSKEDRRIVPIYKENGGVTSARFSGIKKANGDWIGFVDGDDEIEPDMYKFLLENAIKYHAQISHCGYQMIFEDGRVHYFYNTGRLVQQDKTTGLKDLLDGSFIEPGLCNKLFHKTLIHSLLCNNAMDKSIKINEDLLMNYYLFKAAKKCVYEDRCPYHYMVRYTSASRQKLNEYKIFDPLKVKKIILKDSPLEIKEDAQRAYISTCVNTYNNLICDSSSEYRHEKKKVRGLLLENSEWISLLNKKKRLLAFMIRYMPTLYIKIYRIYSKYFQKHQYD